MCHGERETERSRETVKIYTQSYEMEITVGVCAVDKGKYRRGLYFMDFNSKSVCLFFWHLIFIRYEFCQVCCLRKNI